MRTHMCVYPIPQALCSLYFLGACFHCNVEHAYLRTVYVHTFFVFDSMLPFFNRYGRKPTFTTLFFVTGVCLMGSNLLPPMLDHSLPTVSLYVKIGLVLIAKLSLSGIFNVAYFYSAEIFPTEVRYVNCVSHVCVCVCLCTYVCVYLCLCVCVCICVIVCVCACAHVCVYVHTCACGVHAHVVYVRTYVRTMFPQRLLKFL